MRHKEDLDRAAALEKRVAGIVRQYVMQVCLSLLGFMLIRTDSHVDFNTSVVPLGRWFI